MPQLLFLILLAFELLLLTGAIFFLITRAIILYSKLKELRNLHIAKKYEYKVIRLKSKKKIKWETKFGSSDRWKICALENINGLPALIYQRELR